jgi:SSS family transporter
MLVCAIAPLRGEDAHPPMVVSGPGTLPPLPENYSGGKLGSARDFAILVGAYDKTTHQPIPSSLVLPTGATNWQPTTLKDPVGRAAVASTTDAIYLIGGSDDAAGGASELVERLTWAQGKLQEDELPPLPKPCAGAVAAVLNGTLYVFEGADLANPSAANPFLGIDLANTGEGWRTLPPCPGPPRFDPSIVAQYNTLYIIGGTSSSNAGENPLGDVWAYLPKERDGTMTVGWKSCSSLPKPLVGAVALPLGQSNVLLLSGNDLNGSAATGFSQSAELPAYLYNAVTDVWYEAGLSVPSGEPGVIITGPGTFLLPGTDKSGPLDLHLQRNVRNLSWIDYVVVVLYFVMLVLIGGYFSRMQKSSDEFSLGSRKVLWWAAGISMFATGASAITFMAIPALAYATSLIWTAPLLIYIPCYFVQAHLIFPLLRKMNLTSTYEYLEARFNLPLRLIASAQCIILQTFGRASTVLVLPSIAISAVIGVNIYESVIIMGIITTVYTALGGFEAVIWTAVFQGALKLIAPLVMIGIAIAYVPGGFGAVWSQGLELHKFDLYLPTWNPIYPVLWGLIISNIMATTVQIAGDQPIIQRVFSAPMNEVRRVSMMNIFCGIVIGTIVNVMGLAIFFYFRAHPAMFDPLAPNDQIVPLYAVQALPIGMPGVVIAAIFASAMATVASSMNSVATIFTEDFYMRYRPNTSDKTRLRLLRLISYIVGFIATCVALLLASLNLTSLMAAWSQILALLGGGIVGVFSLGMFTRRANANGAIIGVVASVIITTGVKLFTPIHWSLYSPIAIVVCMVVGYFASLFWEVSDRNLLGLTVYTPAPDKAVPAK